MCQEQIIFLYSSYFRLSTTTIIIISEEGGLSAVFSTSDSEGHSLSHSAGKCSWFLASDFRLPKLLNISVDCTATINCFQGSQFWQPH